MPKPHLPVLSGKLTPVMGSGIGPRAETCINWSGPIALVPCVQQRNIYIQRKLRIWREQKCIPLLSGETPLTSAGRQTTPSHGRRNRSENGNLRKLGLTYRHGIVLSPKKYLYPKEATDMERTEMYPFSRCRSRTYLCGPVNYPVSLGSV